MQECELENGIALDRVVLVDGAVNVDGLGLLDNRGHLRPQQELEAMHDLDRNARVITYCGGGIVASTDAFVLTRLGVDNVAFYIASLEEWTTDPDTPMETGDRI